MIDGAKWLVRRTDGRAVSIAKPKGHGRLDSIVVEGSQGITTAMVASINALRLGCFLFSIRHETNRAHLSISDEDGKHLCCASAECTKDDLQRLCNWISDLESSNFLGAPEIIYVTKDLALEM